MLTVVSGSARKQYKNAWCAMNFVCVVVSDLEAEGVQQCKHTGILTKRNIFSSGGCVEVWLRCWFCDLKVPGSSVALTTWWGCFSAVPNSASSSHCLLYTTTNWDVFDQFWWLYVYLHPTIQLEYLRASWSRLDYCRCTSKYENKVSYADFLLGFCLSLPSKEVW